MLHLPTLDPKAPDLDQFVTDAVAVARPALISQREVDAFELGLRMGLEAALKVRQHPRFWLRGVTVVAAPIGLRKSRLGAATGSREVAVAR